MFWQEGGLMKSVRPVLRGLVGASLLAVAMGWPHHVLAQEADETGTLVEGESPSPLSQISLGDDDPSLRREAAEQANPYDAQGLRLGGLRLFPKLELGGIASSNPARTTSGADADAALLLKPALRLESDWSRHGFAAEASGALVEYLDQGELSSTSADVNATLRLDIRHTTQLSLDSGYVLSSAGPADREVPNGAIENRLTHDVRAGARVDHDVGAGTFQLRGRIGRSIYENVALAGGLTEDNGDRTYTEPGLGLHVIFNRGAKFRPFIDVAYTQKI
jgi:hypothetical protein